MKLGKQLLVLGLLASLVLVAAVYQTWATNPPPEGAIIVGPEYWGVAVINCTTHVVTLRVKRVVDCKVETQALIEDYESAPICNQLTEETILHQWVHSQLFSEAGVPIVTKVKNLKKQTFTDPSPPAEYVGDLYSADVQIRFCTNCMPNPQ